MTASFGKYPVSFAGNETYTLTTSFVASAAQPIRMTKKASIFAYYTPGSGGNGNSLSFQVEVNPYNASEDPSGLYWAALGKYVDTSGTWSEEQATFNSSAGTAGTQSNITPLDFVDTSMAQIRIKAKESVLGGSAGTVKFIIATNTIN